MSNNDFAKSKLAPGLAIVIHHANCTGVRDDIIIGLRVLDEQDYDVGDEIPLAVLLEDKPGENSFSIWIYELDDEELQERWINESFACVIPMLTKYIQTAMEHRLRDRAIEGLDDDWFFENSHRVRERLRRLGELWEGMAHRGIRDVDNELTIPCLWD